MANLSTQQIKDIKDMFYVRKMIVKTISEALNISTKIINNIVTSSVQWNQNNKGKTPK